MTTLPFSQRPTETPRAGHREDAMLEFAPETPARTRERQKRKPVAWVAALAAAAVLTAGGVWAFRSNLVGATSTGTLRVESEPAGAGVEVDGSLRGLTPLTVSLASGKHAVVVSLEAQKQEISANVSKGVQSVHYVRFTDGAAGPSGPTGARGRLQVMSDAPGASVSVDGVDRGNAPVTIDGLEPGEHQVVVQGAGKTQRRTVTVAAGATASLVITNAPVGAEHGWMTARTPTPLQIFEGGKLIGTTEADRIMLSAGVHDLEFVADALGFRARRNVTILSGQTATASVPLPQVPANINAVPWADVSIDGASIGQTPIANRLLTIGPHEIEFRHPSLATKRVKIVVSLTEPARAVVDMRTP